MQISQKRVRSVQRVLRPLVPNTRFRVVVAVADLTEEILTNADFATNPRPEDTILPKPFGTVSDYNANGRYVVRKDLPKEERYVTTVEWSWEEWAGRNQTVTRTEDRPMYRECYQRDFYPSPASELTVVTQNGQLLIVSKELTNTAAQENHIRHIINLFLELFGECEIRHANLQAIMPPNIRKVNWRLLPPGQYPWSRVRGHVNRMLEDKAPRYTNPIHNRLGKIASFNPDEVYVGQGGFRSYIAYIFNDKKLAILESVMMDNATYVFNLDWEQVSQLTKAQILQDDLHLERIIHSANWNDRIDTLLQ
jgi:hypothetical protein